MACRAQVRIQHTAEVPKDPPKVEEPAPVALAPEEPKVGDALELPEQIEFEFDEARIKQTPRTLDALQRLTVIMTSNPKITKLRIEGHTDNVGRARHNDKLSKARAKAVAKWLSDHGVDDKRLVTVGFGAKRPLVPNDTDDHRAQNRRTEYYVEELDGKKYDKVASGTSSGGKTAR
jgi:outer membrane protein OmpA-like peptidoglycan-associated protein